MDRLENKTFVERITFTPLAQCSLALCFGSAAALSILRNAEASIALVSFVSSIVVALVVAFTRLPQGVLRVTYSLRLALAFCLLGISLASLSAYTHVEQSRRIPGLEQSLLFKLEEDLVSRNGKYRVLASVEVPKDGKRYLELSFNEDPGLLLAGDCLRGDAVLRETDLRNAYNWDKRICAQATLYSFELIEGKGLLELIGQARKQAIESFEGCGGSQAGILQALICGFRGGIEETGEYEDYKLVGLAHVIAVSGSHLAIVAAFVQALLMRLSVHARYRCALTVAMMCAYFVFTGSTMSAFRSLVMVAVSLCSYYSSRRSSALNALSLCLIAFIATDPFASLSVSLILSAGSTLGIIVFAPLLISAIKTPYKSINSLLVEPVALTCASGIATQAYSAALFTQLPLLALVSNVLTAPLFMVSCVLGLSAALVSVVAPGLSQAFISIAAVSCIPMQLLAGNLSSTPYACIAFSADPVLMLGASVGFSIVLYRWWPEGKNLRKGIVVCSLMLLCLLGLRSTYLSSQDELIMLDVGQGDSFVIRSGGASMMIDTGTNDAMLKQALARNSVFHLEALVISHPDDDHCGSLQALVQVVRVDCIYLHEDLLECPCDNCSQLMAVIYGLDCKPELIALKQGDVLEFGNFRCEVLWPNEYKAQGGNPDSLCMLIEHRKYDWSALMTGDAEQEEIEKMLQPSGGLTVDVLKLGHHGSAGSINEDLLRGLKPEICLISVGEGNRYGHPDSSVIRSLEAAGIMVLRSDTHGDVRLRFKEEKISILL